MFNLNLGNNGANEFKERSKSVFDSLTSLESVHNAKANEYIDKSLDNYDPTISSSDRTELKRDDRKDKAITTKDGEFRVPDVPPPRSSPQKRRRQNEPDHVMNPQKWKRYSLEDVKVSQNL